MASSRASSGADGGRGASDRSEGRPTTSPDARWFATIPAGVLAALTGFALVAMPLAMAGRFRPAPVLIGAALVSAGLFWLWRRGTGPMPEGTPRGPSPRALAVLGLVILAITAMNFRYSAQHFSTERDPGVYVTTGGWLAHEGRLFIDPDVGAFEGVEGLVYAAAGHYEGHREGGELYIQFFHLFPAVLAVGDWIGGPWLLVKVNPLLGALALLLFFAFAARLVRPWLAVAGTAILGLNLVQVYFTRDAYTEILAQALVFGGLWLLLDAKERLSWERGLVAGLALGATCMVRIDSFLYLVPLVAYLVYEELRGPVLRPDRRGAHRSFLLAVGGGAALTASLGLVDGLVFSWPYLASVIGDLRLVRTALLLAAGVGAVAIAVRSAGGERVVSVCRRLHPHLRWIGAVGAAIVVCGSAYAYFLRPHVEYGLQAFDNPGIEMLQREEGLPVDGHHDYAEDTFRWLALYLGPTALGAAVIGLAWMVRSAVMGREPRLMAFLGIFVTTTAVYVWNPNITADHLWAMRRFLPVAIPGLILCGVWLVDRLWGWPTWGRPRDLLRGGGALLVAGSLAFALWVFVPVADARQKVPQLQAVQDLCTELPDDAAVLVAIQDLFSLQFTQTVRSFCRVPAARTPTDRPSDFYSSLAEAWTREGRRLYYLGPEPEPPGGAPPSWPEPRRIIDVESQELEQTLRGRPDDLASFRISMYLTRIPATGEG